MFICVRESTDYMYGKTHLSRGIENVMSLSFISTTRFFHGSGLYFSCQTTTAVADVSHQIDAFVYLEMLKLVEE